MSENRQDQALFEALFSHLIFSLNETAMMNLGKIVNPMTQKTDRDLAQAHNTIDLLRMLKEKTQGNLNEHESHLLEQALMGLQMNYVYESEREPGVSGDAEKAPPE